jgi:hypothetical protein
MIAGVEENSQSRFIDYTFATPWESLCSELEQSMKRWISPESVIVHPDELDHSVTTTSVVEENTEAPGDSPVNGGSSRNNDGVNDEGSDRDAGRAVYAVKSNGSYSNGSSSSPPILKSKDANKTDYKTIITYLDTKYVFSYCKEGVEDEDPTRTSFQQKIRDWFGISNFFLFTGESRRFTATSSQRQTLLSALCTSLHSAGCLNVPAFFAPLDFYKAEIFIADVKGYEILSIAVSADDQLRCAVMYETAVIDGVDPRNELYYLDGLLKHFDQKLYSYSVGSVGVHDAECSVKEIFHYNHDGSSLSQRTQPPLIAQEVLNSQAASSSSSGMCTYSHINYLSQLWCLFPDYLPVSAATSELEIHIRYGDLKQGSFMDNERYTTFQPSKQDASNWSVRAAFKPLPKIAMKRILIDGQVHQSSSNLASCLRRLLAFFTYTHCSCASDVAMISLLKLNKSPESKIKHVDRASSILASANISGRTRAVFDDMFSKIARSTRAPEASKYMSLLFSHHNRWPTNYSGNNDNNGQGRNGSNSLCGLGSLPELLGVAIGSLAVDMQSIAEMWADCVLELRRHWEQDLPLPAMWGPLFASGIDESRLDQLETSAFVTSAQPTQVPTPEVPAQSAWTRHLWNDCLTQRNVKEGNFVTVPDRSQPLLMQKLQYLNFCTLMKKEGNFRFVPADKPLQESDSSLGSVTIDSKINNTSNIALLRRVPLTSDAAAQRKHLEAKLTSGKSNSVAENPLLRWQVTHPALVADIRAYKHKFPDRGLKDFLRWYTGNAELAELGPTPSSRSTPAPAGENDLDSGSEHSSVFSPGIASPSRPLTPGAYRTAGILHDGYKNSSGGIYEEPVAAEAWSLLWDLCEPCAAANQRVMFRVETEAEKCIAYLEDLNARDLSVQLLLLATTSIYAMLHNELRPWRFPVPPQSPASNTSTSTSNRQGPTTKDDSTSNRGRLVSIDSDDITEDESTAAVGDVDLAANALMCAEIAQLKEDMCNFERLVRLFCEDAVSLGTPSKSSTYNSSIVEFISCAERVISRIEALEEKIVRYHEVGTVLMIPCAGPGSRFVTAVCGANGKLCTARTNGDVLSLFELVKFVSRGTESHSWNSEDGRELGKPTKKTFSLKCSASSRLVDNAGVDDPDSPLLTALEHSMSAHTEGGKLFVATKFSEIDS